MTEGERSGADFLLRGSEISVMGGRIFCRTDKFAAPPILCFISVAQPVCAAADTSRLKVQTNVMRADNGAYYLHHCLHALLIDNYCCPIRRNHTNGLKHQTQPLMGARRPEAAEKCPTRDEAAEKTDAGRVAPISGSVFYQIDRLKSGFEVMGRTVMPRNCALMGATRLASGHFSAASGRVAPIRAQCPGTTVLYMVSHLLFNLQI